MSYNLTKRIRPRLADTNVLTHFARMSAPVQVQPVVVPPSELQIFCQNLQRNVFGFIADNFWLLLLVSGLVYYMWCRYKWYQSVSKKKMKKPRRVEYVPEPDIEFEQVQELPMKPSVVAVIPSQPKLEAYDGKNYASF